MPDDTGLTFQNDQRSMQVNREPDTTLRPGVLPSRLPNVPCFEFLDDWGDDMSSTTLQASMTALSTSTSSSRCWQSLC